MALIKLPVVSMIVLLCTVSLSATALSQKSTSAKPIELEVLQDSIGVWDAKIEVWAQGKDSPPMTFNGVETNRAFGRHWIASDFDSKFNGQTTSVHSIVGYDLDRQSLVGTVIDEGPYAAKMTGEYDAKTKTISWTTKVKSPDGKPMVQRTRITHQSKTERVLVLMTAGKKSGEWDEFMKIKFTKRK